MREAVLANVQRQFGFVQRCLQNTLTCKISRPFAELDRPIGENCRWRHWPLQSGCCFQRKRQVRFLALLEQLPLAGGAKLKTACFELRRVRNQAALQDVNFASNVYICQLPGALKHRCDVERDVLAGHFEIALPPRSVEHIRQFHRDRAGDALMFQRGQVQLDVVGFDIVLCIKAKLFEIERLVFGLDGNFRRLQFQARPAAIPHRSWRQH